MRFDYMHPADQLIMIMERIYTHGMTTTSGGNLSIMDDNGDIWITPSGVDKGSLTRQDIMQVKPDGTIIGIHKPSVELPFHAHIYKIRPDIKAVLHAHPPALVAFSLARKVPEAYLTTASATICSNIGVAGYAVPGSDKLGKQIAEQFEAGHDIAMMWNHGVVIGSESLFEAFKKFETLETLAKLQIDASRLNKKMKVLTQLELDTSGSNQMPLLETFIPKTISSEEKAARREMVKLIKRAYSQRLFGATQGTFSQRLSDGSFIITPYRIDRAYLEPEDIVRIQNGRCEDGKTPSRSVLLHKTIYDLHPEINSLILAHPPYIMAFAITDSEFDSRTIPESYIMLRKAQRVPFGESYNNILGVSKKFSQSCPMLIFENDSVMVSGTSLINAFDRLEVAEFSAHSIIAANGVGEIVTINDDETKEIEIAFNLED